MCLCRQGISENHQQKPLSEVLLLQPELLQLCRYAFGVQSFTIRHLPFLCWLHIICCYTDVCDSGIIFTKALELLSFNDKLGVNSAGLFLCIACRVSKQYPIPLPIMFCPPLAFNKICKFALICSSFPRLFTTHTWLLLLYSYFYGHSTNQVLGEIAKQRPEIKILFSH